MGTLVNSLRARYALGYGVASLWALSAIFSSFVYSRVAAFYRLKLTYSPDTGGTSTAPRGTCTQAQTNLHTKGTATEVQSRA